MNILNVIRLILIIVSIAYFTAYKKRNILQIIKNIFCYPEIGGNLFQTSSHRLIGDKELTIRLILDLMIRELHTTHPKKSLKNLFGISKIFD